MQGSNVVVLYTRLNEPTRVIARSTSIARAMFDQNPLLVSSMISSPRLDRGSTIFAAVQPVLPVDDSTMDPFTHYTHWPARLHQSQSDEPLERIQSGWVLGHYARWEYNSEQAVFVSLNRVRCSWR